MVAHTETVTLSHHATLLRGDFDTACTMLRSAVRFDFRSVADPDTSYIQKTSLTIDDVRELTQRSLSKPVTREYMTFIIAADSINTEAQHALLKLTEDPPKHARFVVMLPHSAPLLPTLRSRLHIVQVNSPRTTQTKHTPSLAEDMKDITRMVKDKDDKGMEVFLRTAEECAHANPASRASHSLILARRYIESRGSSPKMLLEHLAIAERE